MADWQLVHINLIMSSYSCFKVTALHKWVRKFKYHKGYGEYKILVNIMSYYTLKEGGGEDFPRGRFPLLWRRRVPRGQITLQISGKRWRKPPLRPLLRGIYVENVQIFRLPGTYLPLIGSSVQPSSSSTDISPANVQNNTRLPLPPWPNQRHAPVMALYVVCRKFPSQ